METELPRRDFIVQLGTGVAALGLASTARAEAASAATPAPMPDAAVLDKALKQAQSENQFTNNWLTDLFDAIEAEVEPGTKVRLLEACGRACYRRHSFKQDIAAAGAGDVDKLITAYRKNFRINREGDFVHIIYGGGKCFCPAARNRAARPNDVHCECTRATHQAVWQAAMGRPYKIELLETVRRGGKQCHLLVHLAS